MPSAPAAKSRVLRRYLSLQLARHHLLVEASEPDEDTEDGLTELWYLLTPRQQDFARGLAADLNWVRRMGELPPQPAPGTPLSRSEILRLLRTERWSKLLVSLRYYPDFIPSAELAFLRGKACHHLQLAPYAAVFFQFAMELAPAGPSYAVAAISTVPSPNPHKHLLKRLVNKILGSPSQYPPVAVIRAALRCVVDQVWDTVDEVHPEKLSNLVRESLIRVEIQTPNIVELALVYREAAWLFRCLGSHEDAKRCRDIEIRLQSKVLGMVEVDFLSAARSRKRLESDSWPIPDLNY